MEKMSQFPNPVLLPVLFDSLRFVVGSCLMFPLDLFRQNTQPNIVFWYACFLVLPDTLLVTEIT